MAPSTASVVVCPSCATKNRVPVSAKGHPRCPKCQTQLPWLVDAGDGDFAARSFPMLLIMRDGEVVETIVGAQPERVFRDRLANHLAG